MDQILDRLWLGNWGDAAAYADKTTQAYPQMGILTLCEQLPPVALCASYVHMPIADEVFHSPFIWDKLVEALATLLHKRTSVLVHCRLGVSRAPSLVAAYLAHCGYSSDPRAALVHIVVRRRCVAPHPDTWRGVETWWSTR
jgi:hypothetical protein